MDIEALRLFTEVAHRLSFAAVAEARGLNPSSVSRAIGQLEDELGLRLFQRTTRRMALTEAGALFHRRVMELVDDFDQARDQARAAQAAPRGVLRLTASVAFGERMIVPLLPAFRAAYPEVKLELLLTDANLDLVSAGVDLAVRLAARIEGDVIATRLMTTRYRVCASPDYLAREAAPRRPQDLEQHRCVLFTLPAFRTAWRFRPGRREGKGAETEITVPIDGDIALSSALSLRSTVLQGAGPALLADWLIQTDLAARRLVDLFPEHEVTATDFDTAAWLLYPSRSYLPQKVRVTIDFLKARLGGGAASLAEPGSSR